MDADAVAALSNSPHWGADGKHLLLPNVSLCQSRNTGKLTPCQRLCSHPNFGALRSYPPSRFQLRCSLQESGSVSSSPACDVPNREPGKVVAKRKGGRPHVPNDLTHILLRFILTVTSVSILVFRPSNILHVNIKILSTSAWLTRREAQMRMAALCCIHVEHHHGDEAFLACCWEDDDTLAISVSQQVGEGPPSRFLLGFEENMYFERHYRPIEEKSY